MTNTLTILGRAFPIREARLHLPIVDEERLLFLEAHGGPDGEDVVFALDEFSIPNVASIADLDGIRIHTRGDGEIFADDTSGADMYGMSDLSCWQVGNEGYEYWEIQIDFHKLHDWTYRCVARCVLTSGDPDSAPPADMTVIGMADFEVQADELHPLEDEM